MDSTKNQCLQNKNVPKILHSIFVITLFKSLNHVASHGGGGCQMITCFKDDPLSESNIFEDTLYRYLHSIS